MRTRRKLNRVSELPSLPPLACPPTPTPTCCWHCLDQRLSLYNPSALFGPGSFSTSHTVGSALLVRRRPRLAPSSLLVNPFQLLAAPPALHEPKASPPLTDTDTQCCTSSLLHPWATVQCSADSQCWSLENELLTASFCSLQVKLAPVLSRDTPYPLSPASKSTRHDRPTNLILASVRIFQPAALEASSVTKLAHLCPIECPVVSPPSIAPARVIHSTFDKFRLSFIVLRRAATFGSSSHIIISSTLSGSFAVLTQPTTIDDSYRPGVSHRPPPSPQSALKPGEFGPVRLQTPCPLSALLTCGFPSQIRSFLA